MVDWGRMKISNMICISVFMSQSRRGNFLTFFFVCSLQKPIGSHWFKKVLIELLSLSFFIKWWKSTQPFFSAWIRSTSANLFFSQKYNIYNFWSTEIYFYGFLQTVWLLTRIPLNFIYTSFLNNCIQIYI